MGLGTPLLARKTKLAIPATGWVGVFGEDGQRSTVPVVAWVYAEFVEPGPDFATDEGTWMWDGLGIWSDGPGLMGEFANFRGYEPEWEGTRS